MDGVVTPTRRAIARIDTPSAEPARSSSSWVAARISARSICPLPRAARRRRRAAAATDATSSAASRVDKRVIPGRGGPDPSQQVASASYGQPKFDGALVFGDASNQSEDSTGRPVDHEIGLVSPPHVGMNPPATQLDDGLLAG